MVKKIILISLFSVSWLAPAEGADNSSLETLYISADDDTVHLYGLGEESSVFTVKIDDQVSDGCWTNTSATKTALELELKRSNKLSDPEARPFDEFLQRTIWVEGFGYAFNDRSCAVTLGLTIYNSFSSRLDFKYDVEASQITHQLMTTVYAPYSLGSQTLMTGPKSDMSSRIKNAAIERLQGFLLKSDGAAKRKVAEAIPEAAAKQNISDTQVYLDMVR